MIRRPLCFALSAFICGIAVRHLAGCSAAPGLAAGLLSVLFYGILLADAAPAAMPETAQGKQNAAAVRRLAAAAFLCLIAGTGVMGAASYAAEHDPYAERADTVIRIEGVILTAENTGDTWKLTIRTADGVRLLATLSEAPGEKVLEGRTVSGAGVISLPQTSRNPGCFDYALYLKSRRIHACIRLEKVSVGGVVSGWRYFFASRKAAFLESVSSYLTEEEQAVLAAMLFGDKSELDDALYESFKRNGTAHALAVSGLHVGMVYGLYIWLFGRRRTVRARVILAGLLFSYAALAGFSPSIVRAVVMIAVHVHGQACHVRYDMLTGTVTAAAVILAVSPYQICAGGFQLSFMAVLLLAFLQPFCEKRLMPLVAGGLKKRWQIRTVCAEALAVLGRWLLPLLMMQLLMAPLTAFLFNYFSLSAFLANLPLVFLAGLVVPAGILLLAVLALPCGVVFLPLGGALLAKLLSLLLFWNRLTFLDGAYSFDAVSPPRAGLFLFYGALFLLLSEWTAVQFVRRKRRLLAAALLLTVCSAVVCGAALSDGFGKADVIFVDVGQGDCVHVHAGSGADLLIDGGGREGYDVGRKTVKPYLLKNRVRRVDAAIVTHLDLDHYGGIVSLCQDGMVESLIVYEGHENDLPEILQETGLERSQVRLAGPGDRIECGGASVTFLGPLAKGGEENEQSLVMTVDLHGRRVLLTGDIGADTEKTMAETYVNGEMRCDILQVPHHGSRYSSSEKLIDAVKPRAAVVQVGFNHYGHPAEEVIERYEDAGIRLFRNDLSGAVGFDLSDLSVTTMVIE